MKIGILSDTHIGYPRFYEDSIRQADEAFKKACDESDLVLVAGDIFDTKTPKFEIIASAMEIFAYGKKVNWKGKGIITERLPVVAIHGTHDRRSKGMVNPVELLERAGLITNASDKVVVFEKKSEDGSIEKVAIHGVGGTTEDSIRETLGKLDFKPIAGAYNILMLHQTIKEVIPMAEGISLEELPSGFDLYLCGHIHKRIVIEKNGKKLLIPGSTVITQLKKEEEEPRAYVILDTKTNELTFKDIDSRKFCYSEIEFKDADLNEVIDAIKRKIDELIKNGESINQPIVRIVVTGTLKQGVKRENLSLQDIYKEYEESCILQIDNELGEQGLKEKLESLRKMYEQKLSVREIGVQSIKKRLENTEANGLDVEFLMAALQDDENIDHVLSELAKRKAAESEKG
ncbi:MAG: metallophosphoesterase family protein [Candidatus Micrarchaeota archaeon]|nr:metallophosphoesterase family protein [Candidatus Micrarchaeota archaeon]